MAKFLSDDWLRECVEALRKSEDFRSEARGYNGDFVLTFEADEGLDDTRNLYLLIRNGECVEASFIKEPVPRADYRISAPYSLWTRMITGEEDAVSAFTARRVKITGNMLRLMMQRGPAMALVKALGGVPLEFN